MLNELKLESISDDDLLRRLSALLKQSRRIESELVAHIAEVDAQRLYAREATPSMFAYCTDVLHLSEAEAYLRITVARATRRHPMLLPMVEDGRLHLRGIVELAPHLTEANRETVLARATFKSKRDIQALVAELAPKPDVPPAMRKLPVRKEKPAPQPAVQLCPDRVAVPVRPAKPAVVEPLAPARYKVQFTASAELHEKLERLCALMPDGDLASLIEQAVTEKLERIEARRFGKTKRPRKGLDQAETSPGGRHISAPVRRIVSERDEEQCTFVSEEEKRCPAREGLEYHHDDPHGRGGDRSPANIRLMCRVHNAYMAERDYGKKVMERYRRSG